MTKRKQSTDHPICVNQKRFYSLQKELEIVLKTLIPWKFTKL